MKKLKEKFKRMRFTNKGIIVVVILIVVTISSCKIQDNEKQNKRRVTSEELISVNRYLVGKDASIIKDYVARNKYDMIETKTGLWYQIDSVGEGRLIKKGDLVKITYSISLLDGTLCYSSDSLGVKTFKVGHGGVESGLEEGILLLSKRAKATFILPPHLAYGLVGDDDKVPARSILLYKVEVVDIN